MFCFRFPRPPLHTTPRINSALLHVTAARLHGAFHFREMSCSMMRVPTRVPLSPPRFRAGRSDGLHVSTPCGPISPWHRACKGFRVKGKGFEPQPLRRACRLVWLMCIVSQSNPAASLTPFLASPSKPPEGVSSGAGHRTVAVSWPHG
jgi:hypothetical protein